MRNLVLTAAAVAFLAVPALADVIRVPQDHATIQAAVTAADHGDKVIIAPGTYPENVAVTAKANLLIRGQGLVTINPPAGNAITVLTSTGVRIKGVSLVTTGVSWGIVFGTSPNGFVAKCRTQGGRGLGAVNSSGTRFVACKVNTTDSGIAFGTPGTYTAERCIVTSAVAAQAFNLAGDTVNLIRCKVRYAGVPTMSPILAKVNSRLYAERCRIQTAGAGPNILGFDLQPAAPSAQHELVRNRIEGCNVAIGAGAVVANNVTCTGNVLSGQTAGGIGLSGTNIVLDRNKILLGAGLTIGIGLGNTSAATISRNKIKGGGAGIWILNGNGNSISRNTFKNLTIGITLTGNANTCGPKNKYRNVTTPIDDFGTNTIVLDTP